MTCHSILPDTTHTMLMVWPVVEAWKAKRRIVLNRGMASGYAGVENPLFYKPNTDLVFGDAKKVIAAVLDDLRSELESKIA